jgi:archaellum component FlaC
MKSENKVSDLIENIKFELSEIVDAIRGIENAIARIREEMEEFEEA